jgi:transcriptional regulator with XRE-family HTH domain
MSGEEFRRHRRRLGFTQVGLAERIGVHEITISRWERDVVAIPEPVAQLVRLIAPVRPTPVRSKRGPR